MIRRTSALVVLLATLAVACSSSPTSPTPAPAGCPIVTNGSTC